ncbi:MAG TPA: MFS transporter, partial [Ktedonobacteraceae bacterium]|nr:MFS transporter [Ktedonobacteraceae bacterium]
GEGNVVAASGASSSAEDLPVALREPSERAGSGIVIALVLANIAMYVSLIPVLSILLPVQIQDFNSADKISLLGLASGVGALLGLVINPLVGALSDRTTSRFGRRRPWLLVGTLLTVASYMLMMSAQNVAVLILGYWLFASFYNFIMPPITALLPDRIPVRQRGTVSGLVGTATPLGIIIGSVLVGTLIQDTVTRYLVLSGIVFVVLLPIAFLIPDKPLPKGYLPPFKMGAFLKSFWISPRKHPDFGLAWLARFVMFLGYFGVTNYLLYYLQDVIHYDKLFPGQTVAQGVATANIFSTVMMIIAAVLGGIISDHFKRRKIFVVLSGIMIALALALLVFLPTWTGVLVAESVMGFGFGAYMAVDQALVTEVLPSSSDRGKDLGVINIANTLPQSLAPIAAAPLLNATHNYGVLFLLGAVIALLGAFVVLPIRNVR